MITSLLDTTKRQPDTEYFNKTTTETDQHGVNTGTSNSRRHRHNNIPAQIQILTSMKDGKVDWLEFWHLTALSTQTDHGYRVLSLTGLQLINEQQVLPDTAHLA